ncbi:glycosyltransferase family A protein [uncultured Thiodictyon sp.]|jgi:glycosyltransferase involved in cell wall biosynthesis|uniref:glycosyltransferase family 2 protein n=1 Tax=uncultured Thiodictyon sp. TaxID=1846217 RepID=UPI0025E92418|nr:glycosyltransferase family A protein [uncultured Thiodictyon sp.]
MKSEHGGDLTIVIPVFRAEYLHDALRSLSAQSCRDFCLLVADDASPDDIASVIQAEGEELTLRYVRFDDNLGSRELTAHWDRAVRIVETSWVLLMGDDDELDPDLVACFYRALEQAGDGFDLYHFNTRRIDGAGAVRLVNTDHPPVESSLQFLSGRFRGERSPYTCAYIFRRSAWERIGGFVSFPLAWCSDDATWVALGDQKGICTVAGPRASWRLSGRNISSVRPEIALQKLRAQSAYLSWLAEQHLGTSDWAPGPTIPQRLRGEAANWFHVGLWRSGCYVPVGAAMVMAQEVDRFTRLGVLYHLARVFRHNLDWLKKRHRG